ncbi:STAS domain-containing protein [Nocardia sp. XZ_19_369]|uniref:STAS domain-containing protein n=1 Tax=Nocardia sp. XZ_19_369 TaxID=2769487 RepID=UPI00188E5388|nr:STAS domain-containing protein [Nocardia sp. XZ_19_369]
MSRRLLSHSHPPASISEYSQGQLRIRVNTTSRGIHLLTIVGELDLATAPLLELALRDSQHARAVVADLSTVGFLGFAGVDVLIRAAVRADSRLRRFAVVASTRPTQRALSLTDAYDRISCYPRVDLAMRAVAEQ